MYKTICVVVFLSLLINEGDSLYCYRCNSNHPGCGTPFNWWWYWGETCPEYDDKCVKIIEKKEVCNFAHICIYTYIFRIIAYISAETIITRECLSSVRSFRKDIPADRYEGCRPAAKDVHLGHYVNNSIHQLDIHRDYYDQITWCFCYFDHRCKDATTIALPTFLLLLIIAMQQFAT
ncbi:LOW QUALITY PROTEIN: UPAR/Ly6 domain-containing protein crim-like [Halictus rubicundus]|uniref:LOW QUALITY PROTEIN: UPAR/Ly6 domain-containing protein crim-like n=1 Tax=Halictus rubicundus TaxID=77578 RepID=UPI004035351D